MGGSCQGFDLLGGEEQWTCLLILLCSESSRTSLYSPCIGKPCLSLYSGHYTWATDQTKPPPQKPAYIEERTTDQGDVLTIHNSIWNRLTIKFVFMVTWKPENPAVLDGRTVDILMTTPLLLHSGKSRTKLPNIPAVYDRSTHWNYDGSFRYRLTREDYAHSRYTWLYTEQAHIILQRCQFQARQSRWRCWIESAMRQPLAKLPLCSQHLARKPQEKNSLRFCKNGASLQIWWSVEICDIDLTLTHLFCWSWSTW